MDYVWKALTTPTTERLRLSSDGIVTARSVVSGGHAQVEYEAILGPTWVFRTLRARSGTREVRLERAGDGGWRVDGDPRPDLAAAIDIDLSVSPFTNTLPIRRLCLDVEESAEIVTAYVGFPSLDVLPDPQRYTRTGPRTYLYESVDGDFAREITVDGDGLVVNYPGLFIREAPGMRE